MKNLHRTLIFIFVLLVIAGMNTVNAKDVYIRINQLGYLPGDIKLGTILSKTSLAGEEFNIINTDGDEVVYTGNLSPNRGEFASFSYTYDFDFSAVNETGKYYVKVGSARSYSFKVGKKMYNSVVDSLMQFFKVQRSGYTDPMLHEVSHKFDATKLITKDSTIIDKKVDLTGGWYDAGDYVKFLNTTAFTTYMLLFAYDFDPVKFGFDNNNNQVPDVLEEAKIGLDWLLRANYEKYKLVSQVQDLRDHDVGWRLPEDDPLSNDRPAYIGMGKNLIGIYSAAMALGARIWRNTLHYDEYANKCLTAAENLYSVKDEAPDIDSSGSGMYIDNNFWGKLALGAIELYETTKRPALLQDAKVYGDSAGSDHWWSWGNLNADAHYRLAKYDDKYKDFIKQNLEAFSKNKRRNLFSEATFLTWGSNNTLLGAALQVILWKRLTGENFYDSLAVLQRDYMLGKNQWGISFIYDIGENHTENFHHQVAYYNDGYLPGGFAAGPVTKKFLNKYNIEFNLPDKFEMFQTDSAVYRDDSQDYVTNEPTIAANATAVFVMGYFSNRTLK